MVEPSVEVVFLAELNQLECAAKWNEFEQPRLNKYLRRKQPTK